MTSAILSEFELDEAEGYARSMKHMCGETPRLVVLLRAGVSFEINISPEHTRASPRGRPCPECSRLESPE